MFKIKNISSSSCNLLLFAYFITLIPCSAQNNTFSALLAQKKAFVIVEDKIQAENYSNIFQNSEEMINYLKTTKRPQLPSTEISVERQITKLYPWYGVHSKLEFQNWLIVFEDKSVFRLRVLQSREEKEKSRFIHVFKLNTVKSFILTKAKQKADSRS